jgi:hypothetical protein
MQKQINDIDLSISQIRDSGSQDIASRAVEIQKQLQEDITSEKRKQLEEELKLAQTQVTQDEINKARIQSEKSATQLIIDRIAQQVAEQEAEKARVMELMDMKKAEIQSEYDAYKSAVQQKIDLDNAYFEFFNTRLRQQESTMDSMIRKMRTLNSLRSSGIEARAV